MKDEHTSTQNETAPNEPAPNDPAGNEVTPSGQRGMGAAAFAVRFPVTISMLFIGIVMLGWISLSKLPTNLFPDLRAPRITVQADAPGLAPQEIERVVIEDLEGRVGTIRGVENVSSVSRSDSGAVIVDFVWGTDMDFAMLEVKKNVQGVNIPEIEEINELRYDPNALPIVTLGLTGDRSLEDLYYLADRTVGPALERIEGVARAQITGGLIPEVHCILKPEYLHFYGLTVNQVANALDQANVSATGGTLSEGNQQYVIRSIGEIKKPEELPRLVVGYSENAPIYLEDVGEVVVSHEEPTNIVRMSQKAGVGISLYKEAGSNTVEVVKKVREFLNMEDKTPSFFEKYLGWTGQESGERGGFGGRGGRGGFGGGQERFDLIPEDTQISIAYDQSMFINRSISEVKNTAIQGIMLAAIILLVFLRNIRTTIIVALAIPVSILATFNLMYFMDLSLNIMTLGGLALGAGMLVDNAIVVIENIFRRKQMGDNPNDAAMNGAGEVGSAIAASTLTTVVVFVPIAYMGGVTAMLFKEQALTVVFSLLTSLIVALMMIPALCSKYLKGQGMKTVDETQKEGMYSRFLRWTLHHRFVTIAIVFLITAASVPTFLSIKQEFIPQAAESQFIVKVRMPPGTKLETTEMAAQAIEGWLMQDLGADVGSVFTRVGPKPDDTGAIEEDPEGPHTAEIMVSMKEGAALSVPSVIEYLEPRAKQIHGMEMNYLMSQTSLSTLIGGEKAALVVEIKGRSLETLGEIARSVKAQMDGIPTVANVRTTILEGNPEVHLIPDRTLLAEANLDQQQLIELVQAQLRGQVATNLQDEDQTKAIRVQFSEDKMNLPELLETIIPIGQERVVSLKDLVEVKVEPGPREILHRNQERVARVLADVSEGSKLSDAVAAVQSQIGGMQVPNGYSLRFGGEEERRRESFERMSFALILALILVYMVMASLFESLLHPFVIMFSLPLAALGVIWAFALTGQTLNLMGYIGIIMLAGIVVNNAIVLIDYINYLRRDGGLPILEAIIQAGRRRLRPIMMTTLTTVLALLPLALGIGEGAEIRAPMAVAVIGGLLSSTILTLVIIPILYSILEDVRLFFLWIFSRIGMVRQPALQEQES